MMKKLLIVLGVVLLLLIGAYFMFVLNVENSASRVAPPISKPMVVQPVERNEDIADYAPEEMTIATSTSGNDKITRVSIGDEDSHADLTVRSHVYTVIHSKEDLKKLEHTLSYVIFPKNLSGHSSKATAVYKRYLQVLEQIQELRKVNKSNVVRKSSPFPRTDNHFVLFKKNEDASIVTIKNYNYELSYKVLDFFREKYPDIRLDDEGPYIITTARNVMNGTEDFSFLYINLSNFNNSAIKEAIESYKKRLVNKGNSDIERLEGWRYSLLSALTNFNADIQIVRSAVAGEL